MANEEKLKFEISAVDTATKIFNQVSAAAKTLEKTYQSLQATFGAVVAALAAERVVAATVEWEKAGNRLTAVLRATSGAVGLTRKELDEMAESLSKSTFFDDKDIKSAEANLLKFGSIHGQVFREALKLSADYAAFTGGDMTSATQAIGRALADPLNGLKALQREVGNLTFTEKQYIEQLLANGRIEEAQVIVLAKVRGALGDTAKEMNTGLTRASAELGKSWDHLLVTLGKQGAAKGGFLDFAAQSLKDIQKIIESPSWLEKLENTALFLVGFRGMTTPELDSMRQRTSAGRIRTGDVIGSGGTSADEDAKKAEELARQLEIQNRIDEAHAKALPVLTQWNRMLGDQTNEQRALTFVLEGEGKAWNDLDKAKLLNLAVELDYRRVYKDRADLSAAYAKALRDETLGEEENLSTRVKVAESAFGKGTRETFRDYIDHARNATEQAAFLFTNMFRNMEDGLVEFVRTGKIDFRSFADSVVADLIRIQVRQALAGFASSAGGFFGGLGALMGLGGEAYPGLQSHRGGIVGVDSQPRMVNPAWFHGAPRMHMGGLAGDEVPVILQRGERVIPRGGSAGVRINIYQTIGDNVRQVDLAAVAQAGRSGAMAAIAEERRRNPNGPFGG